MKKYLLSFISILFFFLLFTQTQLYAAGTGKISGKVTDAQTGEELIGINVLVEGTTTGAATGVDGKYIINNIEPGVYSLVFSGVGYQKKIITNVRVASDFTTTIDMQLSTEAIGLETIIVEATRPMVRKDLTSSQTSIDDAQIKSLPVESIDQLLSMQAGITKGAGGELHIRGGRSTEIAYNVNGVSAVNPFDFSRTVQISTNAVKELSVVSGTFNAEYGNALSGVVNTITKEGGNKYLGTLSYYTGDFVSGNDKVFNNINDLNPINNQVFEGTFGGPIPLLEDNFSFFLSGRYNNDKGYLYGIRQHTVYDSASKNINDPNIIYLAQTGDNQVVSMNPSIDLNLTGKLTFKPISTIKINYDVIYSNSEYQLYNHIYKYNPDANYNRYEWGLINSLDFRHAISSSTFYSFKGSYSIYDFKRYLYPLLSAEGNTVSFRPEMNLDDLHADPRYQPTHKNTRVTQYTFASGGTLNDHFYQRSNTGEIRFDITSQFTNEHDIKLGLKYKWDKMDFREFTILRDTINYLVPTILAPGSASHELYSRSPYQFSGYIQDKMEFTSMIINAGLRFDYFNSDFIYAPDVNVPDGGFVDAEPKITISPRLGISFPITDQGIIHFSYGHFYQLPPYSYLYANPSFRGLTTNSSFGNANLNPEKTISYEMGLQQQLSESIAFNVTGFYKDIRDLLALQQIRVSTSVTYQKYVNKDYGNIKGITFSLIKRKLPGEFFGASLDYTYQTAEGNDTDPNSFFIDISSGRQSEKTPVPLSWDQTHTLNGIVTLGNDKDWLLTVVGWFGTGLPYSPLLYDKQIFLEPNSGRKPIKTNVDLLLEKSFDFQSMMLTLFLKVFNIFDWSIENYVFDDTGRATYSLEEASAGAQETNNISERVPGIKSATEYFVRPDYYSAPREVRLGFTLEF